MKARSNIERGLIGIMAALAFAGMVTSARGGDLNPTAGPTSSNSAMWTLENIYNVLDTHTTNVTKRTAFREPTGLPTNGTMHTLNDIMMLVTNRVPVPKTGVTISYVPYYDDGWYSTNTGMASPTPRFTTNAVAAYSNCVIDNFTGLMWLKNPDATKRTWADALTYCEGLDGADGRGGYTDWRMPNVNELRSLIDYSQLNPALPAGSPFAAFWRNGDTWTSTTLEGYAASTNNAWYMAPNTGYSVAVAKTTLNYVWPVRGGK